MLSVTLAFSVFWVMEADICSIEALVSSTLAACSLAAWLRTGRWRSPLRRPGQRASALLLTSVTTVESLSVMVLSAASMLLSSPFLVSTSTVRSPSETRLSTCAA
jgi:hypothetical protein